MDGRLAAWTAATAIAMALAAGCSPSVDIESPQPKALTQYGRLPGLRATPEYRLREELRRIEAEGGTPEQLDAAGQLPAEQNAAVALAEIFEPAAVHDLLRRSGNLMPPQGLSFDPIRLEKVRAFAAKHDPERLRAREALRRPGCRFPIGFAGGYGDAAFVDAVRLVGRLELFQAALELEKQDTEAALDSLDAMLQWATRLGAEKLAVARLEAAYLRTDAYRVAAMIVGREQLKRSHLERLDALVERQLAAWPPDADAWFGERALGMHAFEMVRDGKLLELLTGEEITRFERDRSLVEAPAAAQHIADRDERFYLDSMRAILAASAEPYYRRVPLFDSLDRQVKQLEGTPDFPIVSARLLLSSLRAGQEIQARDRANWEAWSLALAAALGLPAPPWKTNPLTGKLYAVDRESQAVVVRGIATGEANDTTILRVPLLPPAVASREAAAL